MLCPMGVGSIIAANKIGGGYAADVAGRAFEARGAAVLGKFGAQLAPIEAGGRAELIDQAAAKRIRTMAEIRHSSIDLAAAVAPGSSHQQAKGEADQSVSAASLLMADLNDWWPAAAPGGSIRGGGLPPRGRSPNPMEIGRAHV